MDGKRFRVTACAVSLLAATGCQYRAVSVSYSLPITAQVGYEASCTSSNDCTAATSCSHYAGTAWEDYGAAPSPGVVKHQETTTQLTVWPLHRIRFDHPCERDGTIIRLPPAPTVLVAQGSDSCEAVCVDGFGEYLQGDHVDPASLPSPDGSTAPAEGVTGAPDGWGGGVEQASQQPAVPQPEVDQGVPPELAEDVDHAAISASESGRTPGANAPPTNSIPASAASAAEPEAASPPPAPLPNWKLSPRRSGLPKPSPTVPVEVTTPAGVLEERSAEPVSGETAPETPASDDPPAATDQQPEPPRNAIPPHLQED